MLATSLPPYQALENFSDTCNPISLPSTCSECQLNKATPHKYYQLLLIIFKNNNHKDILKTLMKNSVIKNVIQQKNDQQQHYLKNYLMMS